ncbi:MAG: AEC family transporter [Clostridiales bacterium]|nr:AEC family transporter [Clostridiales bacterium]
MSNLENTALLFVLVLVAGVLIGKAKLLSKPTKAEITNLVLYVTMPCMIVMSLDAKYDPSLIKSFGIILVFAVVVQMIAQLLSQAFFRNQLFERRSVLRYGVIVANSSFFGIPVISTVLGAAALPFAAIYLIPQRVAMWTLGVPCFSNDKTTLKRVVTKTLIHPAMIAVYVGLALLLTGTSIPEGIAAPISMIGNCTMPLAMMLIGTILVEINPSMLKSRQLYLYCLIRLVLIPGAIFAVCLLFGQAGTILHVCVLMAGMPAASTTSLLAIQYKADEVFGSTVVIVSTLLFFAMLPVWMTLFSLVGTA